MRIKLGDVVEVQWADSVYTSGWMPEEEAKEFAARDPDVIITSVGYLFHRDHRYLTLAGHHATHNGDREGLMRIPRGTIRSIRRIEEGKRGKRTSERNQ